MKRFHFGTLAVLIGLSLLAGAHNPAAAQDPATQLAGAAKALADCQAELAKLKAELIDLENELSLAELNLDLMRKRYANEFGGSTVSGIAAKAANMMISNSNTADRVSELETEIASHKGKISGIEKYRKPGLEEQLREMQALVEQEQPDADPQIDRIAGDIAGEIRDVKRETVPIEEFLAEAVRALREIHAEIADQENGLRQLERDVRARETETETR